jgi:hypothetical protein
MRRHGNAAGYRDPVPGTSPAAFSKLPDLAPEHALGPRSGPNSLIQAA